MNPFALIKNAHTLAAIFSTDFHYCKKVYVSDFRYSTISPALSRLLSALAAYPSPLIVQFCTCVGRRSMVFAGYVTSSSGATPTPDQAWYGRHFNAKNAV